MYITHLLSRAIRNNLVVYDADALNGQLTKRLFALCKTISRRNDFGKIVKFYISIDDLEDMFYKDHFWNCPVDVSECTIFGIKTKQIEENDYEDLLRWYTDILGCSFPSGDERLIICQTESELNSFIGAY